MSIKTIQERRDRGLYWDRAWKLVEGCTPVSAACAHCWSARETALRANQTNPKIMARYRGLTSLSGAFNGCIRVQEAALDIPLRTRTPTVFAIWNDLFHENVPFGFIDRAHAVMALCPQHSFLALTKRPERMQKYFSEPDRVLDGIANAWLNYVGGYYGSTAEQVQSWCREHDVREAERDRRIDAMNVHISRCYHRESLIEHQENPNLWMLPNLWLGTTVENITASRQINLLRQTPATHRFLSCEPLLEDLGDLDLSGIEVLIIGGETGPGARYCDPAWISGIVQQCAGAGVCSYVKALHLPAYTYSAKRFRVSYDAAEWSEDMRGCRKLPW